MSATVLSGDVRLIPLADVFLLLNNNHLTGILRCARAGVAKSIEWEQGSIVFARSTAAEDRLGAFLLKRGKVTPFQLQQADPMVGSQDRLGKALIRLGALTPADLWEAVRGQVHEIIYSLFHWKEGQFDFREGDLAPEKISLETTVMNLIMEGTRRLDEWSRVKARIQSDRVVLAPVKSIAEVTGAAHLDDFERTVLGLVDGRRTVREIISLAGRGDFDTYQALYALLSAGVIRIQLVAFDRAPSPPPAKARQPDDAALIRTLDEYGEAVAEVLARARASAGPGAVDRLRRQLKRAEFEQADLVRDVAIDSEGRIDRRLLLANLADVPPGERERLLRAAMENLLRQIAGDLKGRVAVDDVLDALHRGDG